MQTPQKRAKHTHSLSSHATVLDTYDAPHSARKSPPTILFRTSIGPTPQKDGKVLGLFDLLSPASSAAGRTPSKPQAVGSSRGQGAELGVFRTPSKNKQGLGDEGMKSGGMLSGARKGKGLFESPVDASKRAHISSLLTPTARRTLATPSKSTPHSRKAVEPQSSDETPAFLRRHSQHAYALTSENISREDGLDYDNETITWTPVKPRPGPRMAGKALSALVRGLREMEEEKLDEELDILRELENGGNALPRPSKVSKLFDVADSQTPEMPLGPDGAHLNTTNNEDDENHDGGSDGYGELKKPGRGGRFGKESKPWKKKGQKRTTKRSNLRPVLKGTWKPEPEWKVSAESDEDDDNEAAEAKGEHAQEEGEVIITIAETQITKTAILQDDLTILDEENADSDANFEPEPEPKPSSRNVPAKKKGREKGQGRGNGKRKRGGNEHSSAPPANGEHEEEEAAAKEKENPSKKSKPDPKPKPMKKIDPTAHAHANFRALKLRSRGSKGKPTGKGGRRFGRR